LIFAEQVSLVRLHELSDTLVVLENAAAEKSGGVHD
jgi:hypothetical protein